MMLNFGLFELLIIASLALIFIKPQKIPEFMKSLGVAVSRIKDMKSELRRMFNFQLDDNVKDHLVHTLEQEIERVEQTNNSNQGDS
ncbi:MAG: hypothetical protein OXC40_06420 [Proteobacteria bacterium]|nr:hypothetical protein [Pseudomonadota bacterium]